MKKDVSNAKDHDAPLIDRLKSGDLDALGPLYQRYGGAVRSLLVRTEPSLGREGADDLCQEVFLVFIDTLPRYTEQGRLRSWLYGIAVRKARGWRRRTWVRRALGQQHGSAAAGVALQSERTDERLDARKKIDSLLRSLPARQREVVMLRMIEGLSGQETAEVLGISENAVNTRLHRARQALERET